MSVVNSILRAIFDVLLAPFANLPAWVGLAVVSAVVGVIGLLAFKWTSDQDRLAAVKRRILAAVFEIRLFNDNLPAIFRAQGDILRHNVSYIGLTLKPMLVLLVPLLLVFAQLQFHYGYAGLKPGEPVFLKVALSPTWQSAPGAATSSGRPAVTLEAPAGVKVEAGPVWVPSLRELSWRLSASAAGQHDLRLRLGSEELTKSLVSSESVVRRSPFKPKGFLDQVLYPAEKPLAKGSAVEAIYLGYPEASISLLGFEMPWWLLFLIFSFVFAYALKGVFGVTL